MESVRYNSVTNKFEAAQEGTIPVLPQIVWHITDKCLLSCPYCFATKMGLETDIESIQGIINKFKQLGVLKVDLAGGEPLLHNNLRDICKKLANSLINFTITTSGIGTKENEDWLIANCFLFSRIIFSIDGATPSKHDQIRGYQGVYEKVLSLVRKIKLNGYPSIRINTVVTSHLLESNNYKKLIDSVKKIQPMEWCLIEPHPANKKTGFDKYCVTNDEFKKIINLIKKQVGTDKTMIIDSRDVSNYATYWVLYPDCKLKQHTNGATDVFDFDLMTCPINKVEESVRNSKLWLPK